MQKMVYLIVEQTMNNPADYTEGYELRVVSEPITTPHEALELCGKIAESTSTSINSSGDYNTLVVGTMIIEADTQRRIACYYIQPTVIETFT